MHKTLKQSMVFFVISVMVFIPFGTAALAQDMMTTHEMSAEKMIADILLVRPTGIVATVFGAGIFIVSLPFSALGRNTPEVWDKLVVEPASFTFTRALGDLP
ncbi:MAG TPA: hypothetical protein PKV75_04245 [Desulfobacterales bacterium]|nr:hypothetical protein [Desulfobacterales bacterium]